jgi:asparagine synthase (glutamine-hydrolysing)
LLFGSACEPLTLIEGVVSLPPAHSLSISTSGPVHSGEPKCYWQAGADVDAMRKVKPPSRPGTAAQEVREHLQDAVASHLVADVPVGVFLSSGLDSTAIAALASRAQKGIHTFTVAFPDSEFSEAEAARRTAKHFGTEHLEVTISEREMVERLEEAITAFDQPSMDGVNTYLVSWAARQAGLKVALSGLGSDEIFGGYGTFRTGSVFEASAGIAHHFPQPLRTLAADTLTRMSGLGSSPDRLRKASAAFRDPSLLPDPYFFTRLLFTPQAFSQPARADSRDWSDLAWWRSFAEIVRQARSMDRFTRISWLELRCYMLNTLLRDTDAMSMRNSLEVRVPFLDAPLVEYVLSLPESAKQDAPHPKSLLVAALGDLLPQETLAQPKRTFTLPWEHWLRGGLGERVAAGLADWSPALQPYAGGDFARAVWQEFLGGRTSWSRPWSLYVLNEWVKRNIGEDQASAVGCQKPAAVA